MKMNRLNYYVCLFIHSFRYDKKKFKDYYKIVLLDLWDTPLYVNPFVI